MIKIPLTSLERRILSLEELKSLQAHGVCVIEAGEDIPEWCNVCIIDNIPEPPIILRTPGAGVIRP